VTGTVLLFVAVVNIVVGVVLDSELNGKTGSDS
jgi:hypothetical protein